MGTIFACMGSYGSSIPSRKTRETTREERCLSVFSAGPVTKGKNDVLGDVFGTCEDEDEAGGPRPQVAATDSWSHGRGGHQA